MEFVSRVLSVNVGPLFIV